MKFVSAIPVFRNPYHDVLKAYPMTDSDDAQVIDHNALSEDMAALDTVRQNLTEIDQRYGDDLPYDFYRKIETSAQMYGDMGRMCLYLGCNLIQIREHETDADFQWALNKIGCSGRTARHFMQAAVKFSKAPKLADLGKSKMLEFLTEDDDEIAALNDGGTLAGHTLDEYERMTRNELRDALRKAKQKNTEDAETHERLLADKNAKIDKLDADLHKARDVTRPWPSRAFEIAQAGTKRAGEVLQGLDQLDALRETILTEPFEDDDRESAIEAMAVVYYDAVQQIVAKAEELGVSCEEVFSGYKPAARPLMDVDAFRDDAGGVA